MIAAPPFSIAPRRFSRSFHKRNNPGLGTIKQYKTLAAFVQRAKIKPEDLPGVLCKDFNVREVSAAVWLSYDAIKSDLRFELHEWRDHERDGTDHGGRPVESPQP